MFQAFLTNFFLVCEFYINMHEKLTDFKLRVKEKSYFHLFLLKLKFTALNILKNLYVVICAFVIYIIQLYWNLHF